MIHNTVDKIKNYHEIFLFEILINRSIRNKEKDRYSEVSEHLTIIWKKQKNC